MEKENNQVSRESVKNHLEKINNFNDVYQLFKLLKYPDEIIYPSPTRRKKDSFNFKKEEQDKINEIYSIISIGEGLSKGENLQVFLIECKSMDTRFTRDISKKLAELYRSFLVIFTNNYNQLLFVLPENVKEGDVFKLKLTRLHTIKSDLYYTDVDIISRLIYGQENNWRLILKKWKEAFSVERVQDVFFEDYKKIFFKVRDYLREQSVPKKESHEFTLQLLNRIMFIYFISKKGWLREKKFILYLWKEYKKSNETNTFYFKWLKQIFFKAFNNRSEEISGISESVRQLLLEVAPYLNGGLFTESDLDKHDSLKELILLDSLFLELIQGFFEKYNFTIKEDIPLDQEVAVDPQMIGYVYESLANVADEIYDRNDLGIFYTPSVEVEFMCKRSLVEYIWNNMPDILTKENIYHLLFDLPDLNENLIEYFDSNNIWPKLEEVLDNLSVVDPACGSGAFLVGMLNILSDIYSYIHIQSGRNIPDFERKYRIVQRNLYGVDVMPWALHAAELRLWLQLIVESDFCVEELKKGPLLPNLDMNLRRGDSLVQEIGGLTLNLRQNVLNPELKKKLEQLKLEKQKYFESSRTGKFRKSEEIRKEEISIFHEIINQRISLTENKLKENSDKLLKSKKTEQTFLGERPKSKVQLEIEEEKKEKSIEKQILLLKEELIKLNQLNKNILNPEEKPFVWDIDFAEIFGDKGGFDIVIGNPPYVRQEMISPPNKIKSEVTIDQRREYKNKLVNSVKNIFPAIKDVNKKSDYYIYFYFHGLGLLNEKGTLCFITSNSWIDVEYGKDLQEFLLKYVPVMEIWDNPKRSFNHADINTTISLFGPPSLTMHNKETTIRSTTNYDWSALNSIAKFIMFKKPLEEILSSKHMIEIEKINITSKNSTLNELINNVVNMEYYRAFPILHEDLLEDGWEYPEDYDKKKGKFLLGYYSGNKWGGKYLRAPDIFYTILKKGKGKLILLKEIAKIRRGFTTGANDFFYLDSEKINELGIENIFLKSVIKSPKECNKTTIEKNKLKYQVFLCHQTKDKIIGTKALEYIKKAENNNIKIKSGADKGKIVKGYQNLSTLKNKKIWYDLEERELSNFLQGQIFNDKFLFTRNRNYFADCVLNEVILYNKEELFVNKVEMCLNSTITILFIELFGRVSLGEGALKLQVGDLEKLIIINPEYINEIINLDKNRDIKSIFKEIGLDPLNELHRQNLKVLEDRKKLDNLLFNILSLTEEERKELYYEVCELTKKRLEKANSLKK
ncbi:MAG TPA: Eco57I restriction-modification methylase domain-containing protein [Methanofastidiosum sp.]|nr:Eco57I restriction-modification methylase domain-containing protein [Methanofastidiosum sp.]